MGYRLDMLALWVDAIVTGFDPIDLIEGAISSFIHADWKQAQKQGLPGIVAEAGRAFVGANEAMFLMRRFDMDRPGIQVERLLASYGIPVWYRHMESFKSEGLPADTIGFCVPMRQARWAEYILLRAGVPLVGMVYDARNRAWAARYQPGQVPQSNRKGIAKRRW